MERVTKERAFSALDDEQVVREGEIPITLLESVGPEPWDWIATQGRMPGGGKGGRIVLGDTRFPDAALVWSETDDGPQIYVIWVSPDMRRRGVARALLDIYRYVVSERVVISGPFSPQGRALATAYGATIVENPTSIETLKRMLVLDPRK